MKGTKSGWFIWRKKECSIIDMNIFQQEKKRRLQAFTSRNMEEGRTPMEFCSLLKNMVFI